MMRRFGAAGVPVPVIGQGTWNLEQSPRDEAVRALRRGFDLGLTHVDTAEMYGDGAVEEIVGEAIAGRRDELFIASKVLPRNASAAGVVRACEQSLRRLRTDRLDVYLLHWAASHPLEETIGGFEALVREGKVRAWGVSNFAAADLERVAALAGPGRCACNQVLYHLRERGPEGALHEVCMRQNVALVGYTPFGAWDLSTQRSAGGRVLSEIAREHGATVRQVALAFLTRLDGTFAIPKSGNAEHVVENAARVLLDAAEIARLDAVFT